MSLSSVKSWPRPKGLGIALKIAASYDASILKASLCPLGISFFLVGSYLFTSQNKVWKLYVAIYQAWKLSATEINFE